MDRRKKKKVTSKDPVRVYARDLKKNRFRTNASMARTIKIIYLCLICDKNYVYLICIAYLNGQEGNSTKNIMDLCSIFIIICISINLTACEYQSDNKIFTSRQHQNESNKTIPKNDWPCPNGMYLSMFRHLECIRKTIYM